MGSEGEQENERPCHRVWLASFGIARFPVTNREYKQFLEETQRVLPPFWRDPMFSNENSSRWSASVGTTRWHIVGGWSEKTEWLFRLPTEAEWERARAARKKARSFPGATSRRQKNTS